MNTPALAELIIDLDAIANNVAALATIAHPAELMVIVKADGYNHGAHQVASTALANGATQLGVATPQEGIELRRQGITAPITAWIWHPQQPIAEAIEQRITLGIPSYAHAAALIELLRSRANSASSAAPPTVAPTAPPTVAPTAAATDVTMPEVAAAAAAAGTATPAPAPAPVSVTVMADTGLSRSGISPQEWEDTLDLLAAAHREGLLRTTGVMSHLASADDPAAHDRTDQQRRRFEQAIADCRARGLEVTCNHIANTPATLCRPDLHYQLVRPGVGVYGVDPVLREVASEKKENLGSDHAVCGDAPQLRPTLTFRARVVTTRLVAAGERVSYGGTWQAERDTYTAVVAAGYADGVPRSASGKMEVTINGRRYPQIGRVCMDQIVVELGPDKPQVQPGDWAVIFGAGGPSADELAQHAGTIAYEVLTLPRGSRVQRSTRGGATAGAQAGATESQLDLSAPGGCATAPTVADMQRIGERIGAQLQAGTVVCLTGPLGAGKTALTRGIAAGLQVRGRVQSPTFTIVRTHKPGGADRPGMLHMDAYRLLGEQVQHSTAPGELRSRDDVLDMLESLDVDADLEDMVLVAEWGRGVVESLSDQVLDIEISRGTGASAVPAPAESAVPNPPEARRVTWRWLAEDRGADGGAVPPR